MVKAQATRTTTQRIKILEFLRSTKIHPSAEEVYAHVKKELPSITLATVYRNLKILVEQGLVTKIRTGGKWRYDGQVGNHLHAIDTETGELLDIKESKLAEKIRLETKIPGFTITSVHITFYGRKKKKKTL